MADTDAEQRIREYQREYLEFLDDDVSQRSNLLRGAISAPLAHVAILFRRAGRPRLLQPEGEGADYQEREQDNRQHQRSTQEECQADERVTPPSILCTRMVTRERGKNKMDNAKLLKLPRS